MKYEYSAFLFRGHRRTEQIQIAKQIDKLEVGQIICSLLDLKQEFWTATEVLIQNVSDIQEQYYISINDGRFSNDIVARESLLELKKEISQSILSNPGESCLLRFLVILPCFDAYTQGLTPVMRLLMNTRDQDMIRLQNSFSSQTDTMVNEVYQKNQTELSKYDSLYESWNSFLVFLLNDASFSDYYTWNNIARVVFGEKNKNGAYSELLKSSLAELRRIQSDLNYYLHENYDESAHLLRDAFPGPREYGGGSASLIGPEFEEKGKFTTVYEVVSFSELVRAELMLLDRIHRRVQRCKICGKHFVPYRERANACHRENFDFGGKTCAKVYSQLEYEKQHPELNTPEWKEYQKHYKAYSKWAKESGRFVSDYVTSLYDNEEDRREQSSRIISEIVQRQDLWRSKASDSLRAFSTGKISEEAVRTAISIPAVKDRSPLLSEFRKDVAAFLGK